MSYLTIFFYLFLLFIANKILDKFLSMLSKEQLYTKLLSRKSLSTVPYGVFLNWCYIHLINENYTNLNIIDRTGGSTNPSIYGSVEGKPCYVWVIQKKINNPAISEDDFDKVSLSEMQEIYGHIILKNITNSLIITTGDFSEEALEFSSSIPNCSISFLDGCTFTHKFMLSQGDVSVEL